MIILDTSILRTFSPESSSADLLRAIRATGAHRIAVPWVVMEELAAQQAIKYQAKYDAARQAVQSLQSITPWRIDASAGSRERERIANHWRARWGEVVDTIPTSENALREAAVREMNSLPPCKASGADSKAGARDAAIWLSVIEYAKAHPEETIYFASGNTKDFGHGDTYKSPMNYDLIGLDDRFHHWTSLDEALAEFAKDAEGDQERARDILMSKPARIQIRSGLRDGNHIPLDGSVLCWAKLPEGGAGVTPVTSWAPGAVRVTGIEDVDFYSIGTREWCMAGVRMDHSGMTGGVPSPAGLSLDAKVLFTLDADDPGLTILRTASQGPIQYKAYAEIWSSKWMDDLTPVEGTELAMTLIDMVRIQPQRGIPRAYEGAWLRRSATTLSRQMNEILKPIDVPLDD